VLTLALGAGALQAQTSTIYVDGSIGSTSCTTYNTSTRACSGGSATAYRTIAGAASVATAGTTVLIRAGSYGEQLTISRSGTQAQPIVFRAYASESPTISGLSTTGILLVGREYIVIDGLTITDVTGWARLENSSNITIENSVLRRATSTGTTGSVKLVRSSNNRILNNTIEEGNDSLVLVDAADRNVVQGNRFVSGRHTLISIRCSNFNVIRGNTFANALEKAMEIFDCEGVGSDNPIRYDSTKRNLIELNVVTQTKASTKDNDYNGIQHGAQYTITRRNVFRTSDGGGVNFQSYANESLYVYGNRLYNNTFYANKCYGIIGDNGETADYRDMRVKNNLLYKNVSCSGAATQTNIRDPNTVVLTNNAIETTAPGFVNEATYDLHLAAGSREIDAAGALTTTTAAGSGTQMTVQDASYFFDGHDIVGEVGDTIQILGQSLTAVVLDVNYTTNTLTLSRSLTWGAGAGVALQFSGAAPDMGAHEFGSGGSMPTAPAPPTNVRIIR
jgi:parallel beta-helix repeat protein